MNSQSFNELRQDPGLKKYFPEGTSDEDINKIVMKILKERQELKTKPPEPKAEPVKAPPKKKTVEKKKPEKTCSFCQGKGHQRSKCPKKLYPGVDV